MASISQLGRQSQQINFRASEGLHDRLKQAAIQNGRSVNAEIFHRLEASFSSSSELAPAIAQIIDKYVDEEVSARLRAIAVKIGGGNV